MTTDTKEPLMIGQLSRLSLLGPYLRIDHLAIYATMRIIVLLLIGALKATSLPVRLNRNAFVTGNLRARSKVPWG